MSHVYRRYRAYVHADIQRIRGIYCIPRAHKTQDLVHSFFEVVLVRRRGLDCLDRSKGKFRSWLRRCIRNFLADVRDQKVVGELTSQPIPPRVTHPEDVPLPSERSRQAAVVSFADQSIPKWRAAFVPEVNANVTRAEAERLRQRNFRARLRTVEAMRRQFPELLQTD